MADPKATSNSGKMEKAVARAVGGAAASHDGDESNAPVALQKNTESMLFKPTQDQIDGMMADSTLEFAPQVHSLEEGEMVAGFLEGKGPSTTFTQRDPITQQDITREVDTWIIRHPNSGLRISILSSVQLDRKLPPFVGGPVKIYRGKERKTLKGFRVTDYTVAGPMLPGGKFRSWAQPAIIDAQSKAIDAPTPVAQLPSSTGPGEGHGEDATA